MPQMNEKFVKKIQNKAFFLLISIADTCIWLLFNIMPSKYTIKFLKRRCWRNFKVSFQEKKRLLLKNKIKISAFELAKKSFFSTCLSRSTICMILLEFLGIDVEMFLGMYLSKNNKKIPHCWIKVKKDGEDITYQIENCQTIIKI